MPEKFELTSLWKSTLGEQQNDEHKEERDYLRNEFKKFRANAEILAGEIASSLPNYTVHDVKHIDALWITANLVTEGALEFTPAEAFVLGGAFLIHDLGMGIASYPKGIEELKKETIWKDKATALLKEKLQRQPNERDLIDIDSKTEEETLEVVLRELHAQHAGELATISWKDNNGHEIFLLGDELLRESYGNIIGLIAHSHWWATNELEEKIKQKKLGSPSKLPLNWDIDSIKIACVFRIADAMQIDDRRAPSLLRVVRNPSGESDLHWNFQNKLLQPGLENNRIVYTSKTPFTISETDSWWKCFDTLKDIDNELNEVDSLLSDLNKKRLKAFGVAGIEDVKRLSALIEVEGWQPVDTKITVSNVAKLVSNLGGRQLYGEDLTVPLRELIQNASDAIRARRTLENLDETFGEISIRFGEDSNGNFIEVEDIGIGMSPKVLTGPFLDFGQSFWGTSLMHEELPGLEAKGFTSTGKYGIGFFSAFMWGNKVSVTTKRYDKGRDSTVVLEFNKGVESRPILRKANSNEIIKDGGTRIRIWLMDKSILDKLLQPKYPIKKDRIEHRELVESLCPNIDCKVILDLNGAKSTIIQANDWIYIDPEDFIKRIIGRSYYDLSKHNIDKIINDLTIIKEDDDTIVGRAILGLNSYFMHGVVTVGGLKSCNLSGMSGILIGCNKRASRDFATPIVSKKALQRWASDQAKLLSDLSLDDEQQVQCANIIRRCAGNTYDLKVAYNKNITKNYEEIKNIISNLREDNIIIIDDYKIYNYENKNRCFIEFLDNVFWADSSRLGIIYSHNNDAEWPEIESEKWYDSGTLKGLIIEACSEVWGKSVNELLVKSNLSDEDKNYKAVIGYANEKPVEFDRVDIIHKSI